MDSSLSAMHSLAALQSRFDPSQFANIFDAESLLALANDMNGADPPSPPSSACAATENSSARLVEYRQQKVAGFDLRGKEMICLPQVYEIFLKNMVGGLHTVYTKLKRLDITPIICNVEQVRALRGLGAIQPGVNRCKLIATDDFDRLYEDCTNTCTRPGRPPKRLSSGLEDWAGIKRDKYEMDDLSPHNPSPLLLGQLLPQFTAHQLLVQHMIALAGHAKTEHMMHSHSISSTDGDDLSSAELGVSSISSSIDGTPLNLTKTNNTSETGDSDIQDNMRKVDASLSPSQYNSERGGSSGSNGSEQSNLAVNKIINMIDMASEHFKQQRESLQKDKEELDFLRTRMRNSLVDEEKLRVQLEQEKKKSSTYFRRYCKARREALEWKEKAFLMRTTNGEVQMNTR